MITLSQTHEKEAVDFRTTYTQTLLAMANQDKRIVFFDADLVGGIGSKPLLQAFPDRMFNCGISEANMIGTACGASVAGLIPFTHTFGPFATRRVHDQVFMSGAYAKANVKMLGSDPGVTAAYNGGTHMPFEDAGLMRAIPEMTVIDFTDTTMVKNLLPKIKDQYGMIYMRMARKISYKIYEDGSDFTIGKAAKLLDGKDATIFSMGYCVNEALKAAEQLAKDGIHVSVYDMFTLKPIDAEAVIQAAKATGAIVTAENHNIINGLGSAVAEVLAEHYPAHLERVGIKDKFGEVGAVDFLAEKFQITAPYIADAVKRVVKRKKS